MHSQVCVCVYVCMRVCVYVCMRVCVCVCVCMYVYVCVRMYVYVGVHVCIQLNGIVLTYVDPTSLDYLLSPFNEDGVLSAF